MGAFLHVPNLLTLRLVCHIGMFIGPIICSDAQKDNYVYMSAHPGLGNLRQTNQVSPR